MVRPLIGLFLLALTTPVQSQDVDGTIYPRLKFQGEIASAADVDVLEFQAVAGTLLSVVAKADKKELILPHIEVEQTAGTAPLATASTGKKKATVKKLQLPATGIYRILISGDQGTTGGYSVTVKEKVPKSLRRVVTKETVTGGGDLLLSLDALPGDLLSGKVLVKGKTNEASPGTPALDGPGGALPLGDALKTNASGSKLSFAKLPADALGTQELRVPNVGETGEFIARLLFKRPKMPKGVLVEDDPGGGGGGGDDPDLPGTGPTVVTDFGASIAFLYTGPDAPQTGVDPDVFEDRRIAVMTGLVLARGGQPIEGAKVTLVGEDDFGETLTDDTGRWAMALNGGGQHTMEVTLAGYLPVHRTVHVLWRDFAPVKDVVLTPLDGAVTTVAAGGAAQMAQGSVVVDGAGSRQATVLWPAGTTAEMVLPGGGRQPLSSLDVRATEYTVGDEGPLAMPAVLPPASAYTYCVELSVDEALAAGATSVEFSSPLPFYVDNYLDFPVGGDVPLGSYDRESCQWVPSPDGRVLAVVSEAGGEAELDLDGDGDADGDDQALYADFGIDSAELQMLATLYEPGQELWRVSIPHFSPWDCNWPYAPPIGAGPPDINPANKVNPQGTVQYEDPCEEEGSIVEVANQVLGESIPLAGIGMNLVYRSDRVPGRMVDQQIEIPVSGPSVPGSTEMIQVEVIAKGKSTVETFPPLPDQATTYTWDPSDVFGQPVLGPVQATVTVSNRFPLLYAEPADFDAAFAAFGDAPFVANPGLMSFDSPRVFTRTVGVWDARAQGLGGWALEDHHVYAPDSSTLILGDGRRRKASPLDNAIIGSYAGYGNVTNPDGIDALLADLDVKDLALAPDGSLYASSVGYIHRIDPDGIIHRVAGDGTASQSSGDGGPALDATLCSSPFLAVGPDGCLYFSETQCHVIRRIRPDGIVERVAGTGVQATFGVVDEDIPALDAPLSSPQDLALAPDGTLYFADSSSGAIRRVGTDGIISTVVGVPGGPPNLTVDVPAKGLGIANPTVVAVAPDGSVLFDINGVALRRVDTQGFVRMVVGNSFNCVYSGEGVLGESASAEGVLSPVYGPDGTLYYAANAVGVIRSLGTDGILRTVAGTAQGPGCSSPAISTGDGGPALKARINRPRALVLVPDQSFHLGESGDGVRRIISPLPGISVGDLLIADEGGEELFRFDKYGRHLETLDALTNTVLRTFLYDEDGRLIGVRDAEGSEVTIERDATGEPTAIVGPYGHSWQLTLDPDGWLSMLVGPSGETWGLDSTNDGLLTSMQDPVGGLHTFTYDSLGRLELDEGPDGRSLTLDRVVTNAPTALDDSEVSVTATSTLGRQTALDFSFAPDLSVSVSRTAPSGAVTGRTSQPSGDRMTSLPDGTLIMSEEGPDERFGMEAPVTVSVFAMQPGGQSLQLDGERQAVLEDPDDLFSLATRTEIVERNGDEWTRLWDATTRTLTTTTPMGRTVVGELDQLGRMVSLTEGPGLQPWTATYDAQGRVTQLTRGSLVEQYAYDALGRVAQITDGLGRTQQLFHDASDRLTGVTAPSGRAWSVGNDAIGRVTSIGMPSGDVHGYGYDGAGRLASYTPPGGGSFTRSYSNDGEWTGTTLPGGRAVVVNYDPVNGDLLSVVAPEATTLWSWVTGGGGCCETEQLDTLTRMPGVLGQSQSISYSYDGGLETQQIWSGASNFAVAFGWDFDQTLESYTVEGKTRSLARDIDGFLTQDGDFSLSRDFSIGVLTAVDDGTGRIDHSFDDLGRLVGRSLVVNGVTLLSWTLGHDATGRLSSVSEMVDGVSAERGYSFDVDGQLVEETLDGPVVGSWGYDVNGNRTSALAGVATYDAQDRITGFAGTSWSLDADGFLAARGPDTFVHDARGRMLQATVAGTTATYSYDGLGRRSAVHVGADTWEYLYADLFSPWTLSACRDPDGTLTWYQYDEAGSLYAFDRNEVRFYVGCDHLGTPRVVADASGAAVKVVDVDAWGAIVSDSAPGFELPVGFAGGVTDPVTGFVRMGMRDYDPATGRFLTRDPTLIASAQTNLYAYCNNDPLDRLDRSGLAVCVKAKAYRGAGADIQWCVSTEGVSVCVAVGLGLGAGFEFEPFGELAKDGSYNEISIKGKLGPIGVGPKWKFTECGASFKLDCDVGPVNLCQVKGKKKDLSQKPPLSGPKMQEYLKSVLKLKFGLEAVVTGGGCARITW